MASPYIGVYKALYDYVAQTEEELSIAADDILYLLQKSDIDDWWTVKKRSLPQDGVDADEPQGLIPANYIEPAPVVGWCEALYDYDKQTDEEISFKEGERFDLFDLNDPDWLLAGNDMVYGFLPSNYVRILDEKSGVGASSDTTSKLAVNSTIDSRPLLESAPPPVHKDRLAQKEQQQTRSYFAAQQLQVLDVEGFRKNEAGSRQSASYNSEGKLAQESYQESRSDSNHRDRQSSDESPSDEDDAPPPMPTRPGMSSAVSTPTLVRTSSYSYSGNSVGDPLGSPDNESSEQHGFDGEYFRWYIDEVDGRKKRPVSLAIGNSVITLKPRISSPTKFKLKSASSLDNNWRLRDLVNYNHEKKHVFLEFRNPEASIELHAGAKDVAQAIVAVLGDLKGAEAAAGLKEVARAASSKATGLNRRVATLLYDFRAEGNDELSCREHEEIYIVDSSKSKEWWLCERIYDGRRGVVPANYMKIVATTNLDKLTDGVQRRKTQRSSSGSSKGNVVGSSSGSRKHKSSYRSRDDRDKIRESDRRMRDKGNVQDGDDLPNFHRVRTWIDSSGAFKVEAEFLGCMEGKIQLHKTNGVKIAVAATKLSIEDLEYVEKVTGTSLQKYKEEVAKAVSKRERPKSFTSESKPGTTTIRETPPKGPIRSATAVINDVSLHKPETYKAPSAQHQSEPDYDWFELFLSCGVDIGNCQRYSINFAKEQMDESILGDITPSLLRSLGLREGDILRVMKHLDNKFDRKKPLLEPHVAQGGLFTEPTGALKNNSTTELSKVNASALPTPSLNKEAPEPKDAGLSSSKLEDDAWAVKPAARSSEDLSKSAPRPQYTGTLQDLVDVKPLQANKPLSPGAKPATIVIPTTSAPISTSVEMGTLIQPKQQFSVQNTGSEPSVLLRPTRTGNLIPVSTGGLIPVQPTGFMPITAQPTGFVPIQATGGILVQPSFGFVSLQTGNTTFQPQKTGPSQTLAPVASYGQVPFQPTASFVPLQPGNLTQHQGMPLTTFGQQPTDGQIFDAQLSGLAPQITRSQFQSTFLPQSTFGKQITGGFIGPNLTGGSQAVPQTSFGIHASGGMMPQASFLNQYTGGVIPQTSFENQATGGMIPQISFRTQLTGGINQAASQFPVQEPQNIINQMTNMLQNTKLGASGQQFGQPSNSSFPQQHLFYQQPAFTQQPIAQFGHQQTSSFPRQPYGQQPHTSFGQPSFEGFGNQPLQAQPTGLGFGNAPGLQKQATGRRANLQVATADNPFGFS